MSVVDASFGSAIVIMLSLLSPSCLGDQLAIPNPPNSADEINKTSRSPFGKPRQGEPAVTECDRLATEAFDPHAVAPTRYIWEMDGKNAVIECKKQTETSPNAARFWMNLGNAYAAMNLDEEAKGAWSKASRMGYNPATINLADISYSGLGENNPEEKSDCII